MRSHSVLTCVVLLVAIKDCPVFGQVTIYDENFNSGDGSATTITVNTPSASDPAEWVYSATAGVGGSGGWTNPGGQTQSYPGLPPFEQQLILPAQTLAGSGDVTFSFDHTYNFESTWDGGMLMANINGAGWNKVTFFSQNGYSSSIQTDYDWGYSGDFNGEDVWSGSSGGYITSIATLGTLDVGDTVQVMFRGGWDWFSKGADPNWAIDNLTMTLTVAIPEPETYALVFGAGCVGLVALRRIRKRKSA